jgi:hypothetical protein
MEDKEKDLGYGRNPVREDDIGDIFGTLFRIPHNLCVNERNVCHPHARVERCRGDDETHPDFTFEYDWDTTAVIEVKKFWKVTKEQIDQVLNGTSHPLHLLILKASPLWTENITADLHWNKYTVIWWKIGRSMGY